MARKNTTTTRGVVGTVVFWLWFATVGPAAQSGQDEGGFRVHESSLRRHVEYLASPELEGREVGERGLRIAAEYIAGQLYRLGIGTWPPVDGSTGHFRLESYLQEFLLEEDSIEETRLQVEVDGDSGARQPEAVAGVDFGVTVPVDARVNSLPVVFVGFAIQDPSREHDDLAGVDLLSKVALMMNNAASVNVPGDRFLDPAVSRRHFGLQGELARLSALKSEGARAILVAEDPWPRTVGASGGERTADRFQQRRQLRRRGRHSPASRLAAFLSIPVMEVTSGVADSLLSGSGHSLSSLAEQIHSADGSVSTHLEGRRASISVTLNSLTIDAANVLGYIEGTDPELADEVVVLGAHYDHLGARGDLVWHGADDNASGVAATLEVARLLAASDVPLRRSVLFGFWSAEEYGLLGSAYFLEDFARTFPEGAAATGVKPVAAVNIDMVGRPGESGHDAPPDLVVGVDSETVATLEPVLVSTDDLALTVDRRGAARLRSDNRSFVAAGIPTVTLHHGQSHADYHRPTDTPEKIDYRYLSAVTRVAADIVEHFANLP